MPIKPVPTGLCNALPTLVPLDVKLPPKVTSGNQPFSVAFAFLNALLQGSGARRSHGDNTVSRLFCPVDLVRLRLLDPVELGMHVML